MGKNLNTLSDTKTGIPPPLRKSPLPHQVTILILHAFNSNFVAPLGMESGEIADTQISASSQWDINHAAIQGRLNFQLRGSKRGAWSSRSNDLNQWLQVDLVSFTTVAGVATQGRNIYGWQRWKQWVTSFNLQYSVDGVIFQFYKEAGNYSAKVRSW